MRSHRRTADFFKALSHPTRLKIVKFLAQRGETCVCEIIPFVGQQQSNTSQHLSILKAEGILEDRRDGIRVLYKIKDIRLLAILALVDDMLHQEEK